jgi:hypothetical protein
VSFAAILLRALAGSLILAPALALAQDASPPATRQEPAGGFDSLWTGWSGASQESIRAEAEAARRPEPVADAPRRYQAGSAALGERVGEVVRIGDCQEGERLAREAGDFPLVEAVRRHCRPAPQPR